MSVEFSHRVIELLQRYCDEKHEGNVRAASRALELDPETGILSKWLKCHDTTSKAGRFPRLDSIGPVMDKIGVKLVAPWENEPSGVNVASQDMPACRRIAELEQELEKARMERERALAQLELLRDLFREERSENLGTPNEKVASPSSSGSRTG